MTDGIRIQLIKVRSFSLKIARKLYSELRKLYSLKSDSIRQYRPEYAPDPDGLAADKWAMSDDFFGGDAKPRAAVMHTTMLVLHTSPDVSGGVGNVSGALAPPLFASDEDGKAGAIEPA